MLIRDVKAPPNASLNAWKANSLGFAFGATTEPTRMTLFGYKPARTLAIPLHFVFDIARHHRGMP
jgi:hypothetical protein